MHQQAWYAHYNNCCKTVDNCCQPLTRGGSLSRERKEALRQSASEGTAFAVRETLPAHARQRRVHFALHCQLSGSNRFATVIAVAVHRASVPFHSGKL